MVAAALGLLTTLLIPFSDEAQKPAPGPVAAPVSKDPAGSHVAPDRVSPHVILSLFVKKNPAKLRAPVQASPPAARMPVEAPWLSYLGFYSGDPGRPYYLLKDTRAGRVIKIGEGDATNGWSLVEVAEKRMVVRNNDDTYVVNKR